MHSLCKFIFPKLNYFLQKNPDIWLAWKVRNITILHIYSKFAIFSRFYTEAKRNFATYSGL